MVLTGLPPAFAGALAAIDTLDATSVLLWTFSAISYATIAAWLAVAVYCSPAMWRIVFGRARYYDVLVTLFIGLSVTPLFYGVRRIVKLREVAGYGTSEICFLLFLLAVSFVLAPTSIAVLRFYQRNRRDG